MRVVYVSRSGAAVEWDQVPVVTPEESLVIQESITAELFVLMKSLKAILMVSAI
jgi:hypothetical protein